MGSKKRPPEQQSVSRDAVAQAPKKRVRPNFPPSTRRTRSAKLASTTAALMTTEILEKILIQLLMKDLLLSQRVCKKWKVVIEVSKDLQRALFFLPEEPSAFWRKLGQSYNNDGLPDGDKAYRITRDKYENLKDTPSEFERGYSVRKNPLFKWTYDHREPSPGSLVYRCDSRYFFGSTMTQLIWEFSKKARNHSYKDASWRRMYLTQPPTQAEFTFTASSTSANLGIDYDSDLILECSDTRAGTVYASISEHIGRDDRLRYLEDCPLEDWRALAEWRVALAVILVLDKNDPRLHTSPITSDLNMEQQLAD